MQISSADVNIRSSDISVKWSINTGKSLSKGEKNMFEVSKSTLEKVFIKPS